MPKNPDYSKGMIYKLCCKDPTIEEIYIGSTINKKNRKNQHKSVCNNPNRKDYNCYKYQFIREHGGFENWDLIMIEDYSCNSKNELISRERYYIETLKPELNKCIPTRTIKEWREENKDYDKKYYEENIDKIKKYREKNKEERNKKSKEWREKNKEELNKKQKEYREKNKEEISKRHKKWYEKNKEERNKKKREKIKCEKCGCMITRNGLKTHQKTMKCLMNSECLFSDEN